MFLLHPSVFVPDFLILLLLTFCLCGAFACAVWARRHGRKRHRTARWAVRLLGALGFLVFLTVVYGSFIEPQILVTRRFRLTLPLSQPLKIAVIGDLHVGPYKGEAFVRRVVDVTNRLLPDLVLIPGDFLYLPESRLEDLRPLRDLRSSLGVFAVLGNHDMGQYRSILGTAMQRQSRADEVTEFLTLQNIRVLRNTNDIIAVGDEQLAVAGIDDLWTGYASLSGALKDIPAVTPVVLLSHNPGVVREAQAAGIDLIVSGHTHGGQVRLPFIGPLAHLPTGLGQAFDQGLFEIDDDTVLAITRGAGESSARARLFAWPEVMVIEIEPSANRL